jgi:hypothetical protein
MTYKQKSLRQHEAITRSGVQAPVRKKKKEEKKMGGGTAGTMSRDGMN